MKIITRDDLPLIDNEIIKIIMLHQNNLRDIRLKSNDIDLNDFTIEQMTSFVKFCQDKTK